MNAPAHFFVTTNIAYAAHNQLHRAIELCFAWSGGANIPPETTYKVYLVPGDATTAAYEIDDYRPQVDGTQLVSVGICP